MNILYILPRITISHGGFQKHFYMEKKGHKIFILGPKLMDNEPDFKKIKHLNIFYHKIIFEIKKYHFPLSFPIHEINKIVKNYHIDIIHSVMLTSNSTLTSSFYSKIQNIPFIFSLQGGLPIATGNDFSDLLVNLYTHSLGKIIMSISDKVIVLSNVLKNKAISLGIPENKIEICPPGIDINRFNPDNFHKNINNRSPFCVGFVGRFVPLKGILDLLKACNIVAKEYSIHLLLVGDGPLRKNIQNIANSMGIPVTITGWVNNPELYYSFMDVFVLPSYSEGFPRTCLEAMAMEKSLIVTDVGSVKEIIKDGKNGYIIARSKPEDIANKIINLIENRSLSQKWGIFNRNMVKNKYTLKQEISKLENIYFKLING